MGQAMILRFFVLMVGFGLSVVSGVTLIAYLNIITTGHSMKVYIAFILKEPDLYLFLLGIFLISASIYFPSTKDRTNYSKK